MKLSLKFREEEQQCQSPLLRAKIPICILGLPFTSAIAAGDPFDLSFSLQTSFFSGPSLKLSYAPSAAAAAGTSSGGPFSLSLKSGVGLYGSPRNSPLTISARLSLLPNSHHPTFSLQIKPQFGDFSLKKTALSPSGTPNPNPNPNASGGFCSDGDERAGFVSLERPSNGSNPNNADGSFGMRSGVGDGRAPLCFVDYNNPTKANKQEPAGVYSNSDKTFRWKDLKMDSCCGKGGILSGFAVRARTLLPVMKGVEMNFRWGMNFPAEFAKKMPFLTVDKIAIERVDDVKEVKVKKSAGGAGDVELLKGMCFWVSRDLEALREENKEIKQRLEELRLAVLTRHRSSRDRDRVAKEAMPCSVENASDFEQWKSKKNVGQENGGPKKSMSRASNLESELQTVIKAASS